MAVVGGNILGQHGLEDLKINLDGRTSANVAQLLRTVAHIVAVNSYIVPLA